MGMASLGTPGPSAALTTMRASRGSTGAAPGDTASSNTTRGRRTTTPYIRKIREGVYIVAGNQDILMNSKE